MLFLGWLNEMYVIQHCYELAYVAFFCFPLSMYIVSCIDGSKAQ